MAIQMFHPDFHPGRRGSKTRFTVAVLAIAVTGYVAGALVQGALAPYNDRGGFAQPARAAEIDSRDAVPAAATPVTVPSAFESGRFDQEWTQDPRECELEKGISTACMWMD